MAQDGDGWVRDVGLLERDRVGSGASGCTDQPSIPLADHSTSRRRAGSCSAAQHSKAAGERATPRSAAQRRNTAC
jgi:hypothetical protein